MVIAGIALFPNDTEEFIVFDGGVAHEDTGLWINLDAFGKGYGAGGRKAEFEAVSIDTDSLSDLVIDLTDMLLIKALEHR